MRACIDQMRLVFEAIRAGRTLNQPRRRLVLPTGSVLHQMAGAWEKYFATKIYSSNVRHGGLHEMFVLLYDAETGKPLAFIEANNLSLIRTGAAVRLCRRDSLESESRGSRNHWQRIAGSHAGWMQFAPFARFVKCASGAVTARTLLNLRRSLIARLSKPQRTRCGGAHIVVTATTSQRTGDCGAMDLARNLCGGHGIERSQPKRASRGAGEKTPGLSPWTTWIKRESKRETYCSRTMASGIGITLRRLKM